MNWLRLSIGTVSLMFEEFEAELDGLGDAFVAIDLIDEKLSQWNNQSLIDAGAVTDFLLDLRNRLVGHG